MRDTIQHIIFLGLRRHRNYSYTICSAIIFISLAVSIWSWGHPAIAPLNVLMGLLFCLSSFFLLHCTREYQNQCAKVRHLLHHDYTKVAWVYYHKFEQFPFGIRFQQKTTMVIKLLDKTELNIPMKEADILEAMELMKIELPFATYGHGAHKEQLYNIAPDLLMNNNRRDSIARKQ